MRTLAIKTLIKNAFIQSNTDRTFVSGTRNDASLASKDANETILSLLPLKVKTNRIKRTRDFQIVLFIVKQDTPEQSNEQRDLLIDQCEAIFDLFMEDLKTAIENERILQLTDEDLATPEYKIYSGVFSGIGAQFTIKSKLSC